MIFKDRAKFESDLRRLGKSENTIKAYGRDIEILLNFMDDFTEKDLQNSVLHLGSLGQTGTTISRKLSAFKIYNDLYNVGINLATIKKPKRKYEEYSYITDHIFHGNIWKCSETSDPETAKGVFYFLYFTGLRISEFFNYKVEDYNSEKGCIKVVGKGDKIREVPIPDHIRELACSESFVESKNKLKYQTVLRWVKIVYGSAYSPHSFRHGYATKLVGKGVDKYSTKEVMGHASYLTTLRYYHKDNAEVMNEVRNALV